MKRKSKKNPSLIERLKTIPDPRVNRRKRHLLSDILVITICAVLSGAEEWTTIATYGRIKQKWLKTFLRLPNGIPSHDTFGRVFQKLDTAEFTRMFVEWTTAIAERLPGELVAIDGKTLRNSFDGAAGKSAIHMVSAWASANRLVLGQMCVEEKSNEITAVPALLDLLQLEGCVVTLDAMNCQTKTVRKIVEEKKADYVVTAKSNQPALHDEIARFYETPACQDFETHRVETTEKGHGRIETRIVTSCGQLDWMSQRKRWFGLRSIVQVQSTRIIGGKTTRENRYYLTSLAAEDVRKIARVIRDHWSIENQVHWTLDVAFNEDRCRVRRNNAPANLAVVRQITLNMLKKMTSTKVGVKTRRQLCGWENDFLLATLKGDNSLYWGDPVI